MLLVSKQPLRKSTRWSSDWYNSLQALETKPAYASRPAHAGPLVFAHILSGQAGKPVQSLYLSGQTGKPGISPNPVVADALSFVRKWVCSAFPVEVWPARHSPSIVRASGQAEWFCAQPRWRVSQRLRLCVWACFWLAQRRLKLHLM